LRKQSRKITTSWGRTQARSQRKDQRVQEGDTVRHRVDSHHKPSTKKGDVERKRAETSHISTKGYERNQACRRLEKEKLKNLHSRGTGGTRGGGSQIDPSISSGEKTGKAAAKRKDRCDGDIEKATLRRRLLRGCCVIFTQVDWPSNPQKNSHRPYKSACKEEPDNEP